MAGRFESVETEDQDTKRDAIAEEEGERLDKPPAADAPPALEDDAARDPDAPEPECDPTSESDEDEAPGAPDTDAASAPDEPAELDARTGDRAQPEGRAEPPPPAADADPSSDAETAPVNAPGDSPPPLTAGQDGADEAPRPLLLLQPAATDPTQDMPSAEDASQDAVEDAPDTKDARHPDAAPDDAALNATAPEDIAPDDSAPGAPAPDEPASDADLSIEAAPEGSAPDEAPEDAGPEVAGPEDAVTDAAVALDDTGPDRGTADDADPDDDPSERIAADGDARAEPAQDDLSGAAEAPVAEPAADAEAAGPVHDQADARSVWDTPPADPVDAKPEDAEDPGGVTAADPWDAATLRAAADDGAPYVPPPAEADAADTEPDTDTVAETAAPPPIPSSAPRPDPAPMSEPEPVEMALFGKLAARGDFITRNVPRPLQRPLEDWLSRVMNGSREVLGGHWDQAYVSAQAWFFWIGAEAFEDARSFAASNLQSTQIGVLTGVLVPSADRLGRRFPLTLLLGGERARAVPPPTISPPDHRWYGALAARAVQFRQASDLAPVEAALGAMPGPRAGADDAEITAVPPGQPLWAQAGYGGLAEMWQDLSRADHALAASGRSYWWTGGMAAGAVRDDRGAPSAEGCGAQVISVTGLPDPDVFAFMLRCQSA